MTDASPLQKKKLPFKPTALRKTSLPKPADSPDAKKREDDDDLQLFRRAREMAPIVAADRERRLRRKQKKEREREERRRSSAGEKRPLDLKDEDDIYGATPRLEEPGVLDSSGPSPPRDDEPLVRDGSTTVGESFRFAGPGMSDEEEPRLKPVCRDDDLVTPPPSKRSRLGTSSGAGTSSSRKPVVSIDEPDYVLDDSPSTRLLKSQSQYEAPSPEPSKQNVTPRYPNVISLDSDSDSDVKMFGTPSKPPSKPPAPPRESSIEIVDPEPEDDPFDEYVKAAQARALSSAAALKGKIDIIVTSTVPGAQAGCFKVTFDKPLRLVRESWAALQAKNRVALAMAPDDEVVLTWRRKKVYNVDSLSSLGIEPDGHGSVSTKGAGAGHDGLRSDVRSGATRVHMQAWTPALFADMEREEELRRRRDAGDLSDDGADTADEPPPPGVRIKIILKALHHADVKLTVRPETTAETVITGFRAQRDIGQDKDVMLRFDGETLQEHTTMEDVEVEDMDTIEVHIK